MYRFKSFRVPIAPALFATALASQAAPVDLRYTGNDQVLATHVAINDVDNHIYVGSYAIQLTGQPGSFAAYCVEPFQDVNGLLSPYGRSPLVAAHLPPVNNTVRFDAVSKLFSSAYAGSLANGTKAAGFQLALWEVWHDDRNLTTGSIRSLANSDAGMVAEANSLLGSLATFSTVAAYDVTYYFSPDFQDFASADLALEVPEPETFALLLAGLGMLGLARRRRAGGGKAKVTAT